MMKNKLYIALLFMFSAILLTGCIFGGNNQKGNTAGRTISSEDSLFSITVPKGWTQVTDYSLNDEADLQAQNLLRNKYCVVLIENKEDLDYTFDEWVETVLGGYLDNLEDPKITARKDTIIDGQPAKQYDINIIDSKIKLTILVTYINGENNFAQIITWTLASKFKSSLEEFNAIASSIEGL